MKKLIRLVPAAIALSCGCSPHGPDIAGTSEQGNAKFIAALYTQNGAAAVGCKAILRRSDYVSSPDTVSRKTQDDGSRIAIDENGLLVIDSLDTGAYSVEVTDAKAHAALMKFSIGPTRKSVSWGPDTIRQFAVIKGRSDSLGSNAKRFAQAYGLERLVPVASDGAFVFNDLPQGTYKIRIVTADSAAGLTVFDSVAAKAGDTTAISPYWIWKSRASISFNALNVGENVLGFPVLIRLTNINFNFSAALQGGEDLRFAKTDDTPLHFEIERWDAAVGRADIWVKIDTVFGNDSDQSIMMYWGNPAAHTRSESGRVFDTAEGFRSVWHLGDASDTIHDATFHHYNGMRHGSLKRTSCIIGNGQTFDSTEAYCEMGNIFNPGTGSFTVSAWVKRANTGLQTIVAKSNGGTPSSTYGWSLSFGLADQLHCYIASGGSSWGAAEAFDFWSRTDVEIVDTTTWHYVATVVDRSNSKDCRTFIDGVDVTDNCNGNVSAVGSLVNSLPLRIGAEADGGYQWTGSIDECVISHVVRKEAWIRLCYSNQGTNDGLVKIIKKEQ
jgi:hypothetical protein